MIQCLSRVSDVVIYELFHSQGVESTYGHFMGVRIDINISKSFWRFVIIVTLSLRWDSNSSWAEARVSYL